jgi:hypothetical protein
LALLEKLPPLPPDTALIFTHLLNPFGMAWLRRANENNVDLNRNFIPDGQYSGVPPNYEVVNSYLSPKRQPASDFFLMRAMVVFLRYGVAATLQAVAGGQYEFPQNLFFGGKHLEPGLEKYHAFLRNNLASVERALGIDVHTGIGRFSKDLLIVEPGDYEALRHMLGSHVVSSQPKRVPAYQFRGGLHALFSSALSHANTRFLMQEFGTYNPLKVFHALREENRWHHHGGGTLDHATKQRLRAVFFPTSETWRQRVLARGREAFEQALQKLEKLGTVSN